MAKRALDEPATQRAWVRARRRSRVVLILWTLTLPAYAALGATIEMSGGSFPSALMGIPATLSLSIGAAIIWLFFGILLGYLSAVKAESWLDRLLTGVSIAGISIPVFLLGPVLIYFLAEKLALFPNNGYVGLSEEPWEWLTHLVLPWLTVATISIGFYSRVLRSNMLDVMNEATATLPYGKQRLLEIAVAIAAKPRVLLLDEPAAGVPESERHDILAAVAALPRDVTVLLIEHDMDLVFSFADRISVLVNGAMLVEGTPEAVARDPQVKAVYLGEGADA